MRRLLLPAILALSACSANVPNEAGKLPSDYVGGDIDAYWETIQNHVGYVCLDGHYYSASTLWTAHPEARVSKTATFRFHLPSWQGIPAPKSLVQRVVRNMAHEYPGDLGDWYWTTFQDANPVDIYKHYDLTGADVLAMTDLEEC